MNMVKGNEVRIMINGIDVEKINCEQMGRIMEASGYLDNSFTELKYLGIKNNQFIFKYITKDDEYYFVDYLSINIETGKGDYYGMAKSWDIDEDEELIMDYYNNMAL